MEAVIFDFDGVILESTKIKADAFASIYSKYGDDIVHKIVQHHLQNGGMSRYKKFVFYHKKYLDTELTQNEIADLDQKFSSYVMANISDAPFVAGVIDFLKKYYNRYKMFVSSGTPQYELIKTIKLRGLEKYFVEVFGSPQTKEQHIDNILEKYKLFAEQVVFIGDGTRDRDAALSRHLHFIARVADEKSLLRDQKYKIKDFTEIEHILQQVDISGFIA
jgi:phosphoglycolate phosphatase-like HAD superfamily hydrolase